MNFQQLEYALAVHRVNNFSEAAEKCNVTQATLSGMIIKLENEINYKLFDRSKQPIKTTEKGESFMKTALSILNERDALLELGKNKTSLTGTLRLGIIPTIATSVLPIWLPRVMKEFPELDLQIREITTEEICSELLHDNIDLGLLSTPLHDENFQEHILYYEPMMVYGHENPNKEYITTADLQTGKLWLLEEGNCFREQVMTLCELQSSTSLKENIQFKASSFDTLIRLSETTGGMTLLPELYAQTLAPKRKKKLSHFSAPYPVREVSFITHRPHAKAQAVVQLSESLMSLIEPKLSTSSLKKSELQIIGF